MSDNFNSSDIEFEPAVLDPAFSRAGGRSIDAILEARRTDRIESKRASKQLQFGSYGPLPVQLERQRWVNRFETFRVHTLLQEVNEPFTGETLERFLSSIIDKLKPSIRAKDVIGAELVQKAIAILLDYAAFKWKEFAFGRQEKVRIKTWYQRAIDQGRLTVGAWQAREFMGCLTVRAIATKWLQYLWIVGATNWDVAIVRLLTLAIVSATGCRAGDLTYTPSYGPETQGKNTWACVKVKASKGADLLDIKSYQLRLTLKHTKGKKRLRNDNQTYHLGVLQDRPEVDPLTILLVHAMRHGLVAGSTLEEVLANAATNGGEIKFLQPSWPLIPNITHFGRILEINKPANGNQVLIGIRLMARDTGYRGRAYSHALRNGHAQDLAHAASSSSNSISGTTTDFVRESLGHSRAAYARGITDKYVGGSRADLYTFKARSEFRDRFVDDLGPGEQRSAVIAWKISNGQMALEDVPVEASKKDDGTLKTAAEEEVVEEGVVEEGVVEEEDDEADDVSSETNELMDEIQGRAPCEEADILGFLVDIDDSHPQANANDDEDDAEVRYFAFVEKFSRVNSVRRRLELPTLLAAGEAPSGNSRDPPSFFEYKCRCTRLWKSNETRPNAFLDHVKSCASMGFPAPAIKLDIARQVERVDHANAEIGPGWTCTACEKPYSTRKAVRRHITEMQSDGFACDVCGQRYTRPNSLAIHKARVHEHTLEASRYKCQTCEASFTAEYDCRKHEIEQHSGELPQFQCSLCDKKFLRNTGLTRHMQSVHNSNKITCDVCGSTFSRSDALQRHQKKFHP